MPWRRRWRASTIKAPAVPVVANVLAAPISDPTEIKKRLVEQVTGTVRWRECVIAMADAGVTELSTKSAPARCWPASPSASCRRSTATSIGTPADIDAALAPHCLNGGAMPMFELDDKTALVDRRHRRHRRRHCHGAARAGRDGGHLRTANGQARGARRSWASRARPALRPRQQRLRSPR